MPVTNSDIVSLDALLSRWEAAEYAAEAFVIVGCVGEFIAEFSQIRTQEWRHQLGKISLLVLISALALELGALVRTNVLSAQENRYPDHQHPARERQGARLRSRKVASQEGSR